MVWKNIDNFNFKDANEGIPLSEINPLSERAVSQLARRSHLPILKRSFINIYGAIEMMQGLTYHHARFMNIIESCCSILPTTETASALRHEAIAYLNRLGQFWTFSRSDLVKEYCPLPEETLPTFAKLIVFRNKHAAHRSIDSPKTEDTSNLQVMNAISVSIMGPLIFHPKPGHAQLDLSIVSSDNELNEYRKTMYRNAYLGFQIYDVKHSYHVNFFLEKDHELLMQEAYNLINVLLTVAGNTPTLTKLENCPITVGTKCPPCDFRF